MIVLITVMISENKNMRVTTNFFIGKNKHCFNLNEIVFMKRQKLDRYNLYLSELKLFFSLSSCICVCAIFVVSFDLKLIVYVLLKFRRFFIPTLLLFFVFISVFKICLNFKTTSVMLQIMYFSRVSSANRLKNGPFTSSNSIFVSWFVGTVGFGDLLPGGGSFWFQIDHLIYRISFRIHDEILNRVWHTRLYYRQINPSLRL